MKLFDKDSKFIKAIDIIGDLTLLNLTFVLACIPILTIPAAVTSIRNAEIRHKTVVDKTEMEGAVKAFLGI